MPIAQFDKKDSVYGTDPPFPYQSLGNETGLTHTFVDSTVHNGIEYWYCVAAYDKGNQNPDSLEPSYENAKGRPEAPNVVSAVAAPPPSGYNPAYVVNSRSSISILPAPAAGNAVTSRGAASLLSRQRRT